MTIPSLSVDLTGPTPPVEDTIYNAAHNLANPRNYGDPSLRFLRSEESLEQMIKWLMEEHNFTFVTDDLTGIKAFLVCEDGEYMLSVASDLQRDDRLFLYFHVLGHLALGHIPANGSTTIYEFRNRMSLPLHVRFQESLADLRTLQFIESIIGDAADSDAVIVEQLRAVLARYKELNGGPVASRCARASTSLFKRFQLYRRGRTWAEPWLHRPSTGVA